MRIYIAMNDRAVPTRDLDQVHLSLIAGAKRMLTELRRSSLLCSRGIPASYLLLGVFGFCAGLWMGTDLLVLSGLALVLIGLLLAVRGSVRGGYSCCAEDIRTAERTLSHLSHGGTVDRDSENGVADTVIRIVQDSEVWIDATERHTRALFLWPLVAVLVIVFGVSGTGGVNGVILLGVVTVYVIGTYLAVTRLRRRLGRWRSKVSELARLEEMVLGD